MTTTALSAAQVQSGSGGAPAVSSTLSATVDPKITTVSHAAKDIINQTKEPPRIMLAGNPLPVKLEHDNHWQMSIWDPTDFEASTLETARVSLVSHSSDRPLKVDIRKILIPTSSPKYQTFEKWGKEPNSGDIQDENLLRQIDTAVLGSFDTKRLKDLFCGTQFSDAERKKLSASPVEKVLTDDAVNKKRDKTLFFDEFSEKLDGVKWDDSWDLKLKEAKEKLAKMQTATIGNQDFGDALLRVRAGQQCELLAALVSYQKDPNSFLLKGLFIELYVKLVSRVSLAMDNQENLLQFLATRSLADYAKYAMTRRFICSSELNVVDAIETTPFYRYNDLPQRGEPIVDSSIKVGYHGGNVCTYSIVFDDEGTVWTSDFDRGFDETQKHSYKSLNLPSLRCSRKPTVDKVNSFNVLLIGFEPTMVDSRFGYHRPLKWKNCPPPSYKDVYCGDFIMVGQPLFVRIHGLVLPYSTPNPSFNQIGLTHLQHLQTWAPTGPITLDRYVITKDDDVWPLSDPAASKPREIGSLPESLEVEPIDDEIQKLGREIFEKQLSCFRYDQQRLVDSLLGTKAMGSFDQKLMRAYQILGKKALTKTAAASASSATAAAK